MKGKKNAFVLLTGFVLLSMLTVAVALPVISFDEKAIEAEMTASIKQGVEPVLAGKEAIVSAVKGILAQNPSYPGGREELNKAVIDAAGNLTVTGLESTDIMAAVYYALGLSPSIEAYEPPRGGRMDAHTRGGHGWGPHNRPHAGSGV